MIVKILEKQFEDNGYISIPSIRNECKSFVKKEPGFVSVVNLLDYNNEVSMTLQDYKHLKDTINKTFCSNENIEVHMLYLVMYQSLESAKELVGEDYFCWLIDRDNYTITKEPSRVEDYYGLKGEVTSYLARTKEIIESGDFKLIDEALEKDNEKKFKDPKRHPAPATILFVAVNLIVFIMVMAIGDPFVESGVMGVEFIKKGEYYRFFTSMFLHATADHLISNMLILYFMGEMLEHVIGTPKVGIIYLLSGLLGNVVSYLWNLQTGNFVHSLGASGGVYGLTGALLWLAIIKYKKLEVKSTRVFLLVAYCIYSTIAGVNIDIMAHFGGLAAGFLLAVILCRKGGKSTSES